ncbi:hypothetical protein BD626DRAFT_400262 [Schizophyllum amplum]|uniref:Uncharacterized protein n=1 Tax=Schizophyllum amplum TaxID=97359 RepID=A0A550CJ51_9AGAR|nr:hypothetical protein BD626DRAFT_400262 [Auriculariopsis ampla]
MPFTTISCASSLPLDAERRGLTSAIKEMEDCLDDLQNELISVEELMEELRNVEKTLKSVLEVHCTYISSVRRLPKEILSEILDLGCGDTVWLTDRRCTPLALSSVCRSWRDVILGLPHIWGRWRIQRECHLPRTTVRAAANRLRLFLERSGDTPFSQTIEYEYQPRTLSPPATAYLLALIPYTHRWQHLHIVDSTFSVRDEKGFKLLKNKPLPRLITLSGSARNIQLGVDCGVFDIPTLRHVYLSNKSQLECVPELLWGQLETLSISSSTAAYALSIMQRCPNLRTWKFATGNAGGLPEPSLSPGPPTVHKHLRDVRINLETQKVENPLQLVTAPSLESLSLIWGVYRDSSADVDPTPAFLTRSACTLRRLVLSRPPQIGVALIADLCNLVELRLDGPPHSPLTDEFLASLSTGGMLPHLESLELGGALAFKADALIELVESRRAMGCSLRTLMVNVCGMNQQTFGPLEGVEDRLKGIVPNFSFWGQHLVWYHRA